MTSIEVSCVLCDSEENSSKKSIISLLTTHLEELRLNVLFPNIYETCNKSENNVLEIERRDGSSRRAEIKKSSKNSISWTSTCTKTKKKVRSDVMSWCDVTSKSNCVFVQWITLIPDEVDGDSSKRIKKTQQKALSYLRQLLMRWKILQNTSAVWSTKDNKLFAWRKHIEYVCTLGEKTESLEYYLTEHLRMSGVYWGLGTLGILGAKGTLDREALIQFVKSCECKNGGFAGNLNHDPHLLYTLSAVQILAMIDALEYVDSERVAKYIAGLQQPDGSFAGDEWLEIDTRFSYCAVCCLAILGKLSSIDVKKCVQYVMSCCNIDGGFGVLPGAESHAGQIFCCVATLSICNALDELDADRLGWWLAERQCDSGGLNGRPEKQADVCYSWWTLSTLATLDRIDWINRRKLESFILECQDEKGGGISDRPGDMVDIYHTYFGCCGLSLLGWFDRSGEITFPVDPVFALPKDVVDRLKLKSQRLTRKRILADKK
jgi:geranylgeranyl transferase type-2 subunit beta